VKSLAKRGGEIGVGEDGERAGQNALAVDRLPSSVESTGEPTA
jgi:hypothetical protein